MTGPALPLVVPAKRQEGRQTLPMAPQEVPQGSGRVKYPRPVREIHQIEVASTCNLRCKYCPSPRLEEHRERPGQFITLDTYERALHWVRTLCQQGTQGELSLTGIGESLLHPHFPDLVRVAREAIGPDRPLVFSTNGILLTDELCEQLAPSRPLVYISLHRPERAGHAIQAAKKHGIFADANDSAATAAFDWAGQVDWFVSAPSGAANPCAYLQQGWGVVLADGRVTTCCLDASGAGVVGTVWDEPGTLSLKPYRLCAGCHQEVP